MALHIPDEIRENALRLTLVALAALLVGSVLWYANRPRPRGGDDGPLSTNCKAVPAFAKAAGITQPVFDTSKKGSPGLVVYDYANKAKVFQASSWRSAGNLGPIAVDDAGNVYVAPVPNINTLENPADKQNTIYMVDSDSGDMNEYYRLRNVPTPNQDNPYGILDLAYDCESKVIYASSISGSSEHATHGAIIAINSQTKQEIGRIKGVDALSVGLFRDQRGAELYFGLANRSDVWRIGLSADGGFVGKPQFVLNYDQFNELKPRKLEFLSAKSLQIHTTEFRYNLIASTEFRQEYITYSYDPGKDHWQRAASDQP